MPMFVQKITPMTRQSTFPNRNELTKIEVISGQQILRLFAMIEELVLAQNEPRLWTHASLMAWPAFASVGFAVVEQQFVEMGSERLERAMMEKIVAAG